MKIVRFVDPETACLILGKNSSYLFRSVEYYRELERFHGDTEVGDKHENAPTIEEDGKTKHFTRLGQHLVSCWSCLESDIPQETDWSNLSAYVNGVAVISTVNQVDKFLTDVANLILGKCWSLEHKKVVYFEENKQPEDLSAIESPFFKRNRYSDQKEYRFALYNPFNTCNKNNRTYINNLFLSVEKPSDYIESVYLSPNIDLEEKTKVIKSAYLGRNSALIKNSN